MVLFLFTPTRQHRSSGAFLFFMKENEIKTFNLREVIGSVRYTLDGVLKRICDESLAKGVADGLRFVQFILMMANDVDLPDARKRFQNAVMVFNQLTPEQLAELQKKDE